MKRLWIALRGIFSRSRVEADLEEEMQFHLDMETEANITKGMDPKEARRVAILKFGGAERMKEAYRDESGSRWFHDLTSDIRYGLRRMRNNPLFTAGLILIFALGLGATTTMFTFYYNLVVRAVPVESPQDLYVIRERNVELNYPDFSVSVPNFMDWRERTTSWEDMAALEIKNATAMPESPQGQSERFRAAYVSAGYFEMMGFQIKFGRTFTREEDIAEGPKVLLITESVWQSRFGGADTVLGETIRLENGVHSVIGVVPDSIRRIMEADIFIPLQKPYVDRGDHYLFVLGRLKQGVDPEFAESELRDLHQAIALEDPANEGWDVWIQDFGSYQYGDARQSSKILMGSVILLLLIVCLNVSILTLAQSLSRKQEFAVRKALGANRSRILQQLMVEGCLISLAGGIPGILICLQAVSFLKTLLPSTVVDYSDYAISAPIMLFFFVMIILSGVLSSLASFHFTSKMGAQGLVVSSNRSTDFQKSRVLRFLLIAEIAISLAVLVGAGLLIQSMVRLQNTPLYFDTEGITVASQRLPWSLYGTREARDQFYQEQTEAIRSWPGVEQAAWTNSLPFESIDTFNEVLSAPGSVVEQGEPVSARWRMVSQGYFDTMGIRFVSGRDFEAADGENLNQRVMIINRVLAERLWPGQDALGRTLSSHLGGSTYTIIGVVEPIRWRWDEGLEPAMFISLEQNPWWPTMRILIKGKDPELNFSRELMSLVKQTDNRLLYWYFRDVESIVEGSQRGYRLAMVVMVAFGGIALLLSLAGIFAIVSFSVRQRYREIGIRLSLGSSPEGITKLFLVDVLKWSGVGLAFGLLGAYAIGHWQASILYETQPFEWPLYFGVTLLLFLASSIAAGIPALKASQMDPSRVLRVD